MKKKFLNAIALLSLFLFPTLDNNAAAKTYYVAMDGSDAYNGLSPAYEGGLVGLSPCSGYDH